MQNFEDYRMLDEATEIEFLNKNELADFKQADANPLVKISMPDVHIPFIVLPDGAVVADIIATNPKAILNNMRLSFPAGKLPGAGFIDVYHGSRILSFRHIESTIFGKKWDVEDVVSALQFELSLHYPGYKIRDNN